MTTSLDGRFLDHLAEYMIYLSTAPSFWFSLNSSHDHDFHLLKRFGMIPHDYECIMIASNLAEHHQKFGFTIKLTNLNAFLTGHRFCTSNGTVSFDGQWTMTTTYDDVQQQGELWRQFIWRVLLYSIKNLNHG